jgi:hypothetical protein
MEMLREKFLRSYANLPLNLREDIILVFEDKPITWNVAYLEIQQNTKNAEKILTGLKELGLIKND